MSSPVRKILIIEEDDYLEWLMAPNKVEPKPTCIEPKEDADVLKARRLLANGR